MRLRLGLNISKWIGRSTYEIGFVILVKTDNAGVSNNEQFQFTGALGDYDVQVYDSTGSTLQETITGLSDAATITIAAGAGTYELRVLPAETGGFNQIRFNNGGDKDKLLEVRNWGDIQWSSTGLLNAFYGCTNLTSITSFVAPDLSSTTNLFQFAFNCSSLTTLDVSNWDVSNIVSFQNFVLGCTNLTELDVSNWNTSNVLNFAQFISNCDALSTIDVSNWNTAKVQNFGFFAAFSDNLTDIIGIENLDISSITNFSGFLRLITLPTSRYDQLLINYEAQNPPTNLSFDGGNSKFTAGGAAEAARTSLATTYNWVITDGGPA